MRVLGRNPRSVITAPFQAGHYRAFAAAFRVYPRGTVLENLKRYVGGGGTYPYTCRVRTPTGVVAIETRTREDMQTVNEIFCRGDYDVGADVGVAVDVGGNIGLATLFVLTRNPRSRSYAIEPDPKNITRLRENLAAYEGRYELYESAAALEDGETTFYVEPTGRFGGMVQTWKSDSITVPTRDLNAILREVLEREERIDLLKIDTEGTEETLVSGLDPSLLDRIETIVYETHASAPMHLDRYEHSYGNMTNRLVSRR